MVDITRILGWKQKHVLQDDYSQKCHCDGVHQERIMTRHFYLGGRRKSV